MTPEQRIANERALAAGLSHAKNGMAQVPHTPEQECLERANVTMNNVAQTFSRRLKLLPTRPKFHECVELLYPLIRQEFATWSKDDFATLACMHLAITVTQALRDNEVI